MVSFLPLRRTIPYNAAAMPYPEPSRLELPVLLEITATGGRELPRYLYPRLASYFPQLSPADLEQHTEAGRNRWHMLIQRAATQLVRNGELRRDKSIWEITARGARRVETETLRIDGNQAPVPAGPQVTHTQAQQMLLEIGHLLGRHAELEYEHFDVVWRDNPAAPRLSHVFEVQISGSVDSALTRLKQAWDAQRSHIYLVIAGERDTRFAARRLNTSFHEILAALTIIGTGELQRLYESLHTEKTLLRKLIPGAQDGSPERGE
ncbi:MAG: winged helix-turn-helix domain-containing protein [Blastocatellia bacterium]